jgi:Lamin Tail Domain
VPDTPVSVRRVAAAIAAGSVLIAATGPAAALPLDGTGDGPGAPATVAPAHLVVSEVMTGGASASDEFIELYNPGGEALPVEGLEVIYVTASGATATRKATWAAGAPAIEPGGHLLIANEAGVFAAIADATYANGLAAGGGSVAIRSIGATTAIDAVGWGTSTSTWLESRPAPAPAAGSSLERLPGGAAGSGQDTDDNLVDFVVQPVPDPQNSGSTPVPPPSPTGAASPSAAESPPASADVSPTGSPEATPSPAQTVAATPAETASASPTSTATPSPTPGATPISVASARAMPDGSTVTVEGVALTGSAFADGGGYLSDASGGIAVLLSDGSFERGQLVRVTGPVSDRYAQRTIRPGPAGVEPIGVGNDPLPADVATGSVGEAFEGQLVELTGVISSASTSLSGGIAWDVDDGSGPVRVIVGTTTGIDIAAWARGVAVTVVGVVGQRDSSGTGLSGFRVQPRDVADIIAVEPVASPTATPVPSPTPLPTSSPNGSPTPPPGSSDGGAPLVSIGEARAAAIGSKLRIRGVVTAPSGLLEVGSAVVQDAGAGILVRLGGDAGSLKLGQFVELTGIRSTKAGMLSLRVTQAVTQLGRQGDPDPLRRATGAIGEAEEARLVIARGAVSTAVSRPKGGSVSFSIDDGSGPIRVTIAPLAKITTGAIKRGAWLELRAVVGQETTGSAPLKGYRLWPRVPSDLRLIAAPVASVGSSAGCCPASKPKGSEPPAVGGLLSGAAGERDDAPRGIPPVVARPQPTIRQAVVASTGVAAAAPIGPDPAGLVVSGMGLAALASLAAWFGRRAGGRGRFDDASEATVGETSGEEHPPHLALVPIERADAREERRILPPT